MRIEKTKSFLESPIIICGMGRSGTRMIANMLHAHKRVFVTDELSPRTLEPIRDCLHAIDQTSGALEWREVSWSASRAALAKEFFIKASRLEIQKKSMSSDVFANKTPLSEIKYSILIDIFKPMEPIFIYCMRNPKKVIASLNSMPWGLRNTKANWDMYKKSIAAYDEIRKEYRVHLVQIDKVESHNKDYFTKGIFDFLGLDIDDGVKRYIDEWPIAQPASSVRGARPKGLSQEDNSWLNKSPKFREICGKFNYEVEVT